MLNEVNISFHYPKSKRFNKNFAINKKKILKILFNLKKKDQKNEKKIFQFFKKNYEYDYSNKTLKNFKKYKNFVLIGMGGSILGFKAIFSFLKQDINKNFFFLDNLDEQLLSQLSKLKKKNTCVILISKSGNTLETILNFNCVKRLITKKNLIIICEKKNNLIYNLGHNLSAPIVGHDKNIGGRFSVLTDVGMLPSVLAGLKTKSFKNDTFLKNKKFVNLLVNNAAFISTLNKLGYKTHVAINYMSAFLDFCYWYQQLMAESLGKKKKGILPMISIGPKDHHSLMQLYLGGPKKEMFTIFSSNRKSKIKINKKLLPQSLLKLKNKNYNFILNSQSKATERTFFKEGVPVRSIIIKRQNESVIGELFIFFMLEIMLLAELMNINPFDQPEVEKIKIEKKKIIL